MGRQPSFDRLCRGHNPVIYQLRYTRKICETNFAPQILYARAKSTFFHFKKFLNNIQAAKPGASIAIGGIDPVKVMQQMIKEMKENLNLGIGYAVEIDQVTIVEKALVGQIL